MKRFFSLMIVAVLALSLLLTACGNDQTPTETAGKAEVAAEPVSEPAAEVEAKAESAEPAAESEAEAATEAETETEAEAAAEAEDPSPEVAEDTTAETEAAAEAEAKSAEGEAVAEAETKSEAVAKTESDAVAEAAEETRTIIDHAGNEVVIPAKLERIAIGSLTPLVSVYAMFTGSADGLVGIHEDSRYSIEHSVMNQMIPGLAELPSSFSTSGSDDINIEELLKLEPQVYFYNEIVKENYEILKSAGIPAVAFSTTLFEDYSTIDTFNAWVDLLADVLDQKDQAPGIKAFAEEKLALVRSRVGDLKDEEKPRALILSNYNENVLVAGGTSFANYWITTAGGVNLGYDVGAFVAPVNMEQVYEWNPEVLYINSFSPYTVDQLVNNEAKEGDDWSGIAAVQNGRVYKIPKGTYYWFPPSSDAPLNLLFMAKTMHPDLFEDIDIEAEIRSYYQDLFHYELSDEELEGILNPTEGF